MLQVCSRRQVPRWSKNIWTQESCRYHHMDLCPQLKTYKSVTSEVINSKIRATRLQSSNQQNIYHYFIYNRLMDYYHNKAIVQKQHQAMLARA